MRKIFLSVFAVVFFIFLLEAQDKLKADFINPPHQARLQAFWHWQGEYFTKEGITKDLEAMKAAGLGSAFILNCKKPIRNLWNCGMQQCRIEQDLKSYNRSYRLAQKLTK